MNEQRAVIVCTEHRGVFFGYSEDTKGDTIFLKRARMAIYWANRGGVMALAEEGPNKDSRISARADIEVRKVTAVMECSPEATEKWESAPTNK